MRRALLGLAAAAFTVLALASPAGAASGQVTHYTFSGNFAGAEWVSSSPTSLTDTVINASSSRQGSELFVFRFTDTYDVNGNFTGGTWTSADVTGGFSLTLRQPLASASLSASGVPAQTCTIDANFNQICQATTIDVTAAWTGQGPISRRVRTDHFKQGGFSLTEHFIGTGRNASATGTFNGNTLSASQLAFADLGTTKSGSVTVCIGGGC